VIIQTSQTDLNITQATPFVISEQQSRPDQPGELGLRSRQGWSEARGKGVSWKSTLSMRGGKRTRASILY